MLMAFFGFSGVKTS